MPIWETATTGAAMLLAGSSVARDFSAAANQGRQHAATGLILRLGGLPGTALSNSAAGEWDASAQFNDPAMAGSATLYLFHATAPDMYA